MNNIFTFTRMAGAMIVAWSSSVVLANSAMPAAAGGMAILTQAQGLPAEFRDHFFDTPLAIRVELDGKFLGDATVLLTREETVQLVSFTDVSDSKLGPSERQRWTDVLQEPRRLGSCERDCSSGLLALHYSLENSVLAIVTSAAERDDGNARFHALPEGGSSGLILRNYLNAAGGAGQSWAGRYAVEAQGSIGNWTAMGNLQVDQSAGNTGNPRHSVQRLFLQRELDGHFVRAGYFLPDAIGVSRQPRVAGSRAFTTLGVMAGSSDSLSVNSAAASVYPVYVTANREGMVEIYRNGTLINSQPVQAGLQVIDSRQLPGGIYEVELRLVEDGVVTSRSTELIYKPNNWRDPQQRWRYSVFAGQQQSLFDSERNEQAGDLAAGGVLNYLLHPRAVVGLSTQVVGSQLQLGTSVDWDVADRTRLYANVYRSGGYGTGVDAQSIFSYAKGSVVLSHNRAWLDNLGVKDRDLNGAARYQGMNQNTALSLNHRLTDKSNGSARLSHSVGASNGVGLDLSLHHRGQVYGSDGVWRVSVFDRPNNASNGARRNRGLALTLNIALGKEGRRISATTGTRAASQGSGRDQYASLSYQQELKDSLLRNVGATASVDRYGLGLSGNADFKSDMVRGDGYVQRSSLQGGASGGVNLESTVAFGADRVAATGEALSANAGVIVDVVSDVAGLALRADDSGGHGIELKTGRNFVPVAAFKAGTLQFDFDGPHAPTAVIQPAAASYHLNKGGVAYQQIRIMQTVTVMGRLVDHEGVPLKGAHVINHAGRSVTEADGFFAVEMSEAAPSLDIRHKELGGGCQFAFDTAQHKREAGALMVGDVACRATVVQAATDDHQS
ncbi:CS1-pili formation C-terminal domain-containing protein [Herbaspirillum rhizosphaerae]|uniref:CS1-pili formation C-terminal domain-containing protein n=1 Tax=Herbaspirillum rhizosphaerae TaxID=346179 RepID=UPI000AE968C5|nr:CS1-pili formation C-terminal domain-containing protein [Herbaspirillum rhizosphaerae]